MNIISSISSWIVGHISLIIAVLISYFISLLILDYHLSIILGFVLIAFLIVFYQYPKLYVYFVITSVPIMGIFTKISGAFRVGGEYTGMHIGGLYVVLGLTYGIVYLVFKKPRIFEYELTVPMLFFLAVVMISVIFAPLKLYAFRQWARYLSEFILYLLIIDNFKDLKDAKKLLRYLLYLFIIMCIYFLLSMYFPSLRMFMRLIEWEISPTRSMERLGGFIHATSIGTLLVIYIVLSMYYFSESHIKKGWTYIFIIIIMVFLLYNALARNAWITFVVVMSVVGVLRFRVFFLVFLLSFIFVLIAVPEFLEIIWIRMQPDPSSRGRMSLIKLGLGLYIQKPIFGWGQGYFAIYSGYAFGKAWGHYGVGGVDIHNEYLKTLVETGIVGISAYMYLMYRAFMISVKLFKIPHSTAKNYSMVSLAVLMAILLNATTAQGFRSLAPHFWEFMAIGDIFIRNLRSPPQHT